MHARLAALVAEYALLIRRVVRRVGGSRATLIEDDVLQNVTFALWQQLERGQTIERPSSYIFRAAVRETIRVIKRSPAHGPLVADEDPRLADTSGGQDPHRLFEDKERQQALLDALDSLSPERRLAVRAHLSGFDVQEIMGMFDWSYQRARHLVARGMADLRRGLRARGIHD